MLIDSQTQLMSTDKHTVSLQHTLHNCQGINYEMKKKNIRLQNNEINVDAE